MKSAISRVVGAGLAAMLTGTCAAVQPAIKPVKTPEVFTVSSQKWFSVDKKKKIGGCKIDVSPEKGADAVVVRGWQVSWLLVNTCDNAPELELQFYLHGRPANPITFEKMADGVLKGKVREDLKDEEVGAQNPYKYSVKVGNHIKDPEIIIF